MSPVPYCAVGGVNPAEVERATPTDILNSSIQPFHGSVVSSPPAPTRSALVLLGTVPENAAVASCTPLTNRRSVLLSRSTITCHHEPVTMLVVLSMVVNVEPLET